MAMIFLGVDENDEPELTLDMEIDFAEMGEGSSAHVKYMMVNGMKACYPSVNAVYGDLDVGSLLVYGTASSIFIGTVVSGSISKDGIKATLDGSYAVPGEHHNIYYRFLSDESRLWDVCGAGEASRACISDIIEGRSDLKITTKNPLIIESRPLPADDRLSAKAMYKRSMEDIEQGCSLENMITVDYIDIRNLPQTTARIVEERTAGIDRWHYDFIKPVIDKGYHTRLSDDNNTMFVTVSSHDLNLMNPLERFCHERGKCWLSWTGEYYLKKVLYTETDIYNSHI